jgi:hypothetical protein
VWGVSKQKSTTTTNENLLSDGLTNCKGACERNVGKEAQVKFLVAGMLEMRLE